MLRYFLFIFLLFIKTAFAAAPTETLVCPADKPVHFEAFKSAAESLQTIVPHTSGHGIILIGASAVYLEPFLTKLGYSVKILAASNTQQFSEEIPTPFKLAVTAYCRYFSSLAIKPTPQPIFIDYTTSGNSVKGIARILGECKFPLPISFVNIRPITGGQADIMKGQFKGLVNYLENLKMPLAGMSLIGGDELIRAVPEYEPKQWAGGPPEWSTVSIGTACMTKIRRMLEGVGK